MNPTAVPAPRHESWSSNGGRGPEFQLAEARLPNDAAAMGGEINATAEPP